MGAGVVRHRLAGPCDRQRARSCASTSQQWALACPRRCQVTQDPAAIVYTPGQVSALTLAAIEERQNNRDRGVSLGVPAIDKVLKPLRPGELVSIVALSSNWKT